LCIFGSQFFYNRRALSIHSKDLSALLNISKNLTIKSKQVNNMLAFEYFEKFDIRLL